MLRFISMFIFTVIIISPASGDGWFIETVETGGLIHSCIALDSAAVPHISYFDQSNEELKYAHRDGSTWNTEVICSAGEDGGYTSLALDSNSDPHIAYFNDIFDDLEYAYWTGSVWNIQAVDTAGWVGYYPSLVLDDEDDPHISYCSGDLKYACWTGSLWDIQFADTGGVGGYSSLALASGENPHIAYYDIANEDLKYAFWTGSAWSIQQVDTTGNVGHYISMALDDDNAPHISYFNNSTDDMKYAFLFGSIWDIQIVDNGICTSLALTSDGNPRIAYYNLSDQNLRYARWLGSSWEILIIVDDISTFISLALDSGYNPHISFYNSDDSNLSYTFYNTAPANFSYVSPLDDTTICEPVTLDWENADDPQQVIYDVLYSTDPYFATYEEITDLTESTYTFNAGDLDDLTTYYWKVHASDGFEETWSGPENYWTFTVDNSTGIEDEENLPSAFNLYPVIPNPSHGSATISFSLSQICMVEMALYDIKGRRIANLASGQYQPGIYSVTVSGLPSGVYFCRLNAEGYVSAQRLIVIE